MTPFDYMNYTSYLSMQEVEAQRARTALALAQLQLEEERMTPYTPEDLSQNWEFKIVRSPRSAFGKSEELDRLREEEARSGWVMVEKFDNARVRFKRRTGAHARADEEGVDPYRTVYENDEKGASSGLSKRTLLICFLILALLFVCSRMATA